MKNRQKNALLLWGIGLILLLMLLPLKGSDNLYSSVIRIHILADSDKAEDQRVKLQVRDRLLAYSKDTLKATSREEAQEELQEALPQLEEIANEVLDEEGVSDRARVTLSQEFYPQREYEGLSLPAGRYLSLRVSIGEAQGQNWWCLFFPPICLDSSVEADSALLEAGMSEKNVKTVTIREGEYRLRFKLLDLFSTAKEKISALFS